MPTMIASDSARIACTASKAGAPVTIMRSPSRRPIMPSAETASFSVTCGRPAVDPRDVAGMGARGLVGEHAGGDRDAGRRAVRIAAPGDARVGVLERADDAARRRRRPAHRRKAASAVMGAGLERDIGGGAARRLAGLGKRHRLGMRPAADAVTPRPTMIGRRRSMRTISAPTAGLGQVWPRLRRPSGAPPP